MQAATYYLSIHYALNAEIPLLQNATTAVIAIVFK